MRPADLPPSSPQDRAAADRLDRVWAATRPADPSPLLLDALWAQATAELDRIDAARATPGAIIPIGPRPRRRRLMMALVLAQAAALLVAATLALTRRGAEPAPSADLARATPPVAPAAPAVVDVENGQTLVIRIDGDAHRVVLLDQAPTFPAMPENTPHDFFNDIESRGDFTAVADNATHGAFDETKATP